MAGRILTEVAIVGGGLVGCSTALHFARRRVPCVLLEAERCGAHASGVNYGGIRIQGRALAELPLAERARRIWGRLERIVGADGEFRATGHLRIARDEAEAATLERWALEAARHGVRCELLPGEVLRSRFPWLGEGFAAASYCPDDGQANPRIVTPLFARTAREEGATILEGRAVVSIERTSRGFLLRAEPELEVEARVLVNAAGAWGAAIAAMLGERLPSEPIAPNMLVSEPLPFKIEPNIGMAGPGIYLRQVPSGSVVFGGGRGSVDLERRRCRPLFATSLSTIEEACRVVPELARASIIRTWAGIEGRTPDDLPVIGPSTVVPGLFHAFGFSGHGFMLAPAVGIVLVELVLDGHSATSLEGLSPSRSTSVPAIPATT